MVGDENHFQKGSQLREEIASGISEGRKVNEKQLIVFILDFQVWFLFPFHRNFLPEGEKHEHNVI